MSAGDFFELKSLLRWFFLSFSGLEHGEYEWKDPETEDEVYAYWFILREWISIKSDFGFDFM